MPEHHETNDLLFDVIIEQPGGDHNRYTWDPDARAPRLIEVGHPSSRRLADRAVVPNTLTETGSRLSAILLVSQSVFPGARVQARALGVVETNPNDCTVVAVATVDPAFADRRSRSDLTESERMTLEALVPDVNRWGNAAEAARVIRAARERLVWAHAEAQKGQRLAWKADSLARSGRISDAFTTAEHDVRALPLRFQTSIAECLTPDERIIMFVTRPQRSIRWSGLAFWRTERRPEGLLVVTDRRVLWLDDALPPDRINLIDWGYVAHATATERVAAVQVEESGEHVDLIVTIGAARGTEAWRVPFPTDRLDLLDDVARLLRAFIPTPGTRLPRRLYLRRLLDSLERSVWPSAMADEPLPAEAIRLEDVVRNLLVPGESALAAAFAPSRVGRRVSRLVVVSDRRVLLVAGSEDCAIEDVPISNLTSVLLRNSLIACTIELRSSPEASSSPVIVPFDYPQGDGFVRVFRTVSQLLGEPDAGRIGHAEGGVGRSDGVDSVLTTPGETRDNPSRGSGDPTPSRIEVRSAGGIR